MLYESWSQSAWSSFTPPLILSAAKPDSVVMRRFTSSMADISREKMATGILLSTAAFLRRFSENAVLPTDGRAPRMIRFDFCHPNVYLSNVGKPEGTPLIPDWPCISSISSNADFSTEPTSCTSFFTLFWIAAKTLDCDMSMRSSTFWESSYAPFRMS